MGATKTYPITINDAPYEIGLVLQAKSEVDCNEFGLQQATLRFATFNRNLKKFRAPRGTPLTNLRKGDDPTRAALRDLDYLGVQTSRMIRSGLRPGKGIWEVMAQGAIFNVEGGADNSDPITTPWTPRSTTDDESSFSLYRTFQDPSSTPFNLVFKQVAVATITLKYSAPQLHYEYMARDKVRKPRFIQNEYHYDSASKTLLVPNEENVDLEIYSATGSGIIGSSIVTGSEGTVPEATWREKVKYVGSGKVFQQTQAGAYWHVLETTTIKIQGIIPQIQIPAIG